MQPTEPKIVTQVDDHVLVIRINRPHVGNCVDRETAQLLEQEWLRFRDDDDLHVAVLTGTGEKLFCAGADLKGMRQMIPELSRHGWRRFVHDGPGYMGYTRGTDIFKPIIAALNGSAYAGGLELACLADIRVAGSHARFGCLERRFNVPLADGGTQRLPHIVGLGRALELILTGDEIDAAEAHRIGLVNRVVAPDDVLGAALELAARIARMPQGAIRSDKQAVMTGLGRPLDEGLRIEAQMCQTVIGSADFEEGMAAFQEKRPPRFRND
jgi:enoyl-CoA hydratase